ncbi:MAG: hypothetical protein ABI947_13395 [Chloroflexota bacterium]
MATMINHVWVEQTLQVTEAQRDSADILVETEDGVWWRGSFVTIEFLQRQMYLSREIGKDIRNMAPVPFIALETPHIIVENLLQDTIEDTIDNLMTLGIFENVFSVYEEYIERT